MIKYIIRKIRLLSNARKEPYLLFRQVLGFFPNNMDYYQLAVRHKSTANWDDNGQLLNNERLEFLGDAVLNSVVTDLLFHRYKDEREGFLTNTRSKIVKRKSLNQLALEMGLSKLVKVTEYVNANTNNNIYGNALEALVGAIYLDYGYKRCKKFVENRLFHTFVDIEKIVDEEVNFKSNLIEWCQKYRFKIEFILLDDVLSSINRHVFTTRLMIENCIVAEATGASKKASQQNVSELALQIIKENPSVLAQLKKESSVPSV